MKQRDAWLIPGIQPSFGFVCTGDCMIPTFYPGEIAYIHAQNDFNDGQVAAIEIDGQRLLKRVYHVPEGVRCSMDNPTHKPFTVASERVKVIGIAVARGCQQS